MKNLIEYKTFIDDNKTIIENIHNSQWALNFHLMPLIGWLNDPNGLCKIDDEYHIYFQFTPEDCNWGMKCWGHVITKDFLNYEYKNPFLYPDNRYDIDGVYSGSCFQKDDLNYYFYTGNVKKQGNYDYINEGREQNTILVTSEDGFATSKKQCVLTNDDYPKDMSCHVRDPQIFEYNNHYYMFLGARTKDSKGCILIYESSDLASWNYHKTLETNNFGYMLECPNFIELANKHYLICCPQGIKQQKYQFQNIYSCGYFEVDKSNKLKKYYELDYGFDFYAPQVFNDGDRTILIGWMGIPDADYTNPTTNQGWQHALTMPRELFIKNGKICQKPIKEMQQYRHKKLTIQDEIVESAYELSFEALSEFMIRLDEGTHLIYKDNILQLKFDENVGYGRGSRYIKDIEINNVKIFKDTSSIEIFINDGEYVMTSRFYPQNNQSIKLINGNIENVVIYSLDKMQITY